VHPFSGGFSKQTRFAARIGASRSLSAHGALLGACLFLAMPPLAAYAESIQLSCERESVTAPGWNGPLSVSYEGGETGTLVINSDHTQLSLTGTLETNAEDGAKLISAFQETTAIMPDLAALDSCTAAKVPKDFAGDADFYNVTSMSCLETVEAGADPVPIKASVRIGILPPQDVIIEITRTYLTASTGPGGVMYIETYPAGCKVDGAQ